MGGGHVDRGRRARRGAGRGLARPRHRTPDTDGEPAAAGATGSGGAPEDTAARDQFFGSIRTSALVVAAAGLVALGMVARWASDTEQTGSALPTATVEVPPATDPSTGEPGQAPDDATRTVSPGGRPTRELVVVPDSDCGRFVQTRQEFPTLTISVENLCQ